MSIKSRHEAFVAQIQRPIDLYAKQNARRETLRRHRLQAAAADKDSLNGSPDSRKISVSELDAELQRKFDELFGMDDD